jgi:hypothetical protein
VWHGVKLSVTISGLTALAVFSGTEDGPITSGAQNSYLNIDTKYTPNFSISQIITDQNNKRLIVTVSSYEHKVGVYYLLDGVTSGTNVYGFLCWPLR